MHSDAKSTEHKDLARYINIANLKARNLRGKEAVHVTPPLHIHSSKSSEHPMSLSNRREVAWHERLFLAA